MLWSSGHCNFFSDSIGQIVFPNRYFSASLAMEDSQTKPPKGKPLGIDASCEEEYSLQSKLLKEFVDIPTIDKAWTFTSSSGKDFVIIY